MGGLFDFRVTPKSKFMLDVHLDVEFDNDRNHCYRVIIFQGLEQDRGGGLQMTAVQHQMTTQLHHLIVPVMNLS